MVVILVMKSLIFGCIFDSEIAFFFLVCETLG